MLRAYIITVIISLFIAIVSLLAADKRLKKEGFCKRNKVTAIERIDSALFVFVPVLNVIVALAFILMKERIFAEAKEAYKRKYAEEE